VVGVLVWLAASLGFSSYVSNFGTFGMTYGALGGVVFLLLWMFISTLALMLGAEINAVLADRRQHRGEALSETRPTVARRAPG
jgi:membrane protein